MVEVLVAPGRLALPHRHEREDELCLVMDGQVGWRVGDRELGLAPGSATFLPRGVPMRTGIRVGRRLGWCW